MCAWDQNGCFDPGTKRNRLQQGGGALTGGRRRHPHPRSFFTSRGLSSTPPSSGTPGRTEELTGKLKRKKIKEKRHQVSVAALDSARHSDM